MNAFKAILTYTSFNPLQLACVGLDVSCLIFQSLRNCRLVKYAAPYRTYACADPQSFVRGGPILMCFIFFFSFLVYEGGGGPNTTLSGLSFKWRVANVPIVAQH